MRLVVVGCGYVGLVSGACFAELGHEVVCVDTDVGRIKGLKAGMVPIFEPGLAQMIGRTVAAGRLRFAAELPDLDEAVDAAFIAVGTPPSPDGHGADLRHVYAVAEAMAGRAVRRLLVVTKSTVPVGTGDMIEAIIRARRPDLELDVASNPEFLREGSALHDFMKPDRIVLGSGSPEAIATLQAIYAPITQFGVPVLSTGRKGAELIKYAANAFLAVKITFINEIADLCESVGTDIDDVADGIGLDRRIGRAFLEAGPGYGGSCFPKDTAALIATAQDWAVNLRLVETTIASNDARKRSLARRVAVAMGGSVNGKRIAVLGLTFKPNTDDMRDAPSIALVAALQRAGATLKVYDPEGMPQARSMLSNVEFAVNAYDCAENADCVVVMTDWDEFSTLDYDKLANLVRMRLVVDLRNKLDKDRLRVAGFTVASIGRPAQGPAVLAPQPASKAASDGPGRSPRLRAVNGSAPGHLPAAQEVARPDAIAIP
ncbi:MAG: UDP-glucose 6-dehydrogenase [Devosia sp.]|nr:UDP-glucose 6-dehydrogenase [Devosia sp.]